MNWTHFIRAKPHGTPLIWGENVKKWEATAGGAKSDWSAGLLQFQPEENQCRT